MVAHAQMYRAVEPHLHRQYERHLAQALLINMERGTVRARTSHPGRGCVLLARAGKAA